MPIDLPRASGALGMNEDTPVAAQLAALSEIDPSALKSSSTAQLAALSEIDPSALKSSSTAQLAALPGIDPSALAPSITARLAALGRRLFGMPDYEEYLHRHARCAVDHPPLTEREFVMAELERKYAGGGGRCC